MEYAWSFGGATFKGRLVQLMEEKGLSQQAVAQLAGVGQGTVSRWLSGSVPDLGNVETLASKTDVPLAWLAHGEGHLDVPYEGIDGFIQRARKRIIPRLNSVLKSLDALKEVDFLSAGDRENIEKIWLNLHSRRVRLSECVDALESLPADETQLVAEILSKLKTSDFATRRMQICMDMSLDAYATDEEILKACRTILKKNPRPRLAARKRTLRGKAKP
jgi:transcriptional regulator with XRE-family HTH domain